jgi:uncharacterized protein YbbK (DUF523 family)
MAERSGGDPRSAGFGDGSANLPLLVSACLLGVPCNHLGRASPSVVVMALAQDQELIPICQEVAGGLPVPRPAAELQPDDTVVTAEGTDVTGA